ncbi:MAG: SpoIIE family protein phosphatase [Bryobacteraceae bacterium]|nr:SpoIIE family protein phosphatase [Bryobacteraceae bacterium]
MSSPVQAAVPTSKAAALVVVNPAGNRSKVPLEPLPFLIGRQADNNLVLRDNRVSRTHARIVADDGGYVLEDLGSTHGVHVNGERVERHKLVPADRIEFGVANSYSLIFTQEESDLSRLLDQFDAPVKTGGGTNLAKLKAVVEVARALETSLSTDDVLAAVVDAALIVTGTERGFLLLRDSDGLEVRVARDRYGAALPSTDLRVPRSLIQRALDRRRELLHMNFDPNGGELEMDRSVAFLELRSVVCVPLVRLRSAVGDDTGGATPSETVGLLYMDSRAGAADLSAGNRELLQTLALEASTILENARLLEQERRRRRLEDELNIAREIQIGLLPRNLPSTGWFRIAAATIPSHQVGGDYYDLRRVTESCWTVVAADVSGKGVSSALLASLLQGAFLFATEGPLAMEETMMRVNHFLNERTGGEKYATIFYCSLERDGMLHWCNAGHCAPILVARDGTLRSLGPTGTPAGLLDFATFEVEQCRLSPGDQLAIFTDGVSEAQNAEGEFFETRRIREVLKAHAGQGCAATHQALMAALAAFTGGTEQSDDITCVVLEYREDV